MFLPEGQETVLILEEVTIAAAVVPVATAVVPKAVPLTTSLKFPALLFPARRKNTF